MIILPFSRQNLTKAAKFTQFNAEKMSDLWRILELEFQRSLFEGILDIHVDHRRFRRKTLLIEILVKLALGEIQLAAGYDFFCGGVVNVEFEQRV